MAEYEDLNDLYDEQTIRELQKAWKSDILSRWLTLHQSFKHEIYHLPFDEMIKESRRRVMKIFYDEGKVLIDKRDQMLTLEDVYVLIDSGNDFDYKINWRED